jgi:hypothetical protein
LYGSFRNTDGERLGPKHLDPVKGFGQRLCDGRSRLARHIAPMSVK